MVAKRTKLQIVMSLVGVKPTELKNEHIRAGKGSRIVDTVKYLLEDSSKWQPITTKQDYHFPGVLKDVTEQYLLYTPDVYQLSQATTSNPHFMWYDKCSKGKTNVDRKIKFRIDQKEQKLM